MTNPLVARIRELDAQATAGPWMIGEFGNPDEWLIEYGEPEVFSGSWSRRHSLFNGEPTEATGLNAFDAAWIAESRTLLPAAADLLVRLEAALRTADDWFARGDFDTPEQCERFKADRDAWRALLAEMEDSQMSKRQPKFDTMIDGVRVRVYATHTEYEALIGDGEITDPDAPVWCFPKVGSPSIWARQALLNHQSETGS